MSSRTPKARIELRGKMVTGACIAFVALLVIVLVFMVAQRGIATFTVDGVSLGAFLTGTTWNPHQSDAAGMPTVGALPMISGSFAVLLLSTLFALPIAIGSAIFVVEIAPGFGRKVFQPLIELLVGIPSVVYGLIGLTIIVAWVRGAAASFGQTITGFGVFSSAIVLAIMILPTITSLSIDALSAVPREYVHASVDVDLGSDHGNGQRGHGYRLQRRSLVPGASADADVAGFHLGDPSYRQQGGA